MAKLGSSIQGDVTVEETRLNTKGGSMTAILRKRLSEALGTTGGLVTGARLDFGQLASVVLLAPSRIGTGRVKRGRIRITRMTDRRFVVDLIDDNPETIDPFTQAFLTMIVEQFKRGQRKLVDRETALAELEAVEQPAGAKRSRG